MDIRSLLSFPPGFNLFNCLLGGLKVRRLTADTFVRAQPGDQVLDLGCGTADILHYLPPVHYTGIDNCRSYIESARKRFGARGTFLHQEINAQIKNQVARCDIVLGLGVLHHLDDSQAVEFLTLARSVLKSGGRLITLDGCYREGQSPVAHFILTQDRGKHVRKEQHYRELAQKAFQKVQCHTYDDLLRIPYSHLFMECS